MKIPVRKYGLILASREAGREAVLVMRAYAKPKAKERIELDFEGVISVGPSWLDEVLTLLRATYGRERVVCLPTKNASVIESLRTIDGAASP